MIPLSRPLETDNPLLAAQGLPQFSQSLANRASRETPTLGRLLGQMTNQGEAANIAEMPVRTERLIEENRYQVEADQLQYEMQSASPDELPDIHDRLKALEDSRQVYLDDGTKDLMARGRVTSPMVLAEKYKLPGLKFDRAMSDDEAKLIYDNRKAELIREAIIANSPTGFLPGVQRFGNSLIAMATDPLEVASMFIPVLGEAGKAAALARFGNIGGHVLVGAVEGGVGNALTEPAYAFLSRSQQDDYTAMDSLMNIGAGFVLGGGIGAVAGFATRAAKAAPTARVEVQAPEVAARVDVPTPDAARADRLVLQDAWRVKRDTMRLADEQRPVAETALRQMVTDQPIHLNEVMPRELTDFPVVRPGDRIGTFGMARAVNEAPIYRDTAAGPAWDFVQSDITNREELTGAGDKFFSSDPDLAIGQNGNSGIILKMRPNSVAVAPSAKIGTTSEFRAEAVAPRSIDEIVITAPDADAEFQKKIAGIWGVPFNRQFREVPQASFSRVVDGNPPVRVYQRVKAAQTAPDQSIVAAALAKHAQTADSFADDQAARRMDEVVPYDEKVMTDHIADLELQTKQLDEATLSEDQIADFAAIDAENERFATYAEVAEATAICLART